MSDRWSAGDSGLVLPDRESGLEMPLPELLELSAVSYPVFAKTFFPETVRQDIPDFHLRIWSEIEDIRKRLLVILVFRGGAKTTMLRLAVAKRVAFGISRTILYIGPNDNHARRSVRWLRRQIEINKKYSETFGLCPGSIWTDGELQISHTTLEHPIWIKSAGITGSLRGINFDDWRPDFIVLDDVLDDQNCISVESREKIKRLILGAVKESLAPRSEAPNAKLVMLQTPIDFDDATQEAKAEAEAGGEWSFIRVGIWTPETEDLPVEQQESVWPERFPTEDLRKEKLAAIARNRLSIFVREKECKLISPEMSTFRPEWIRYYDPQATGPGASPDEPAQGLVTGASSDVPLPPLEAMTRVMVVDPVPPPSERQIEKGLIGKDFEAIAIVGRSRGKFYVLEYSLNRGHEPNWTVSEIFRLAIKYNVRRIIVESVAYQRTLAWLIREGMRRMGRYWPIEEYVDRRSKYDRIVDNLSGVLSEGALYIRRDMAELVSQIIHYPQVEHDDILEATAIGVGALSGLLSLEDIEAIEAEYEQIEPLRLTRGCP